MPTQEEIKYRLIAAHRVENWELAKLLSQQKEEVKKEEKKHLKCCVCDVPISNGERCQIHYRTRKYYGKSINDRTLQVIYGPRIRNGRHTEIKPRHIQLLSCVGEGYTQKEIADELGISHKTVAYHISSLYKILRMNNPSQLIRTALAFGLCSPLCLILMVTGCKTPAPVSPPPPPAENTPPFPIPLAKPVKPVPMVSSNTTSNVAKLVAPFPTNTVTLAWDPSPSTNVDGYRLYQGSISKTYTNTYDVGSALMGIVNAAQGTNYFNVKAYIKYGPSNELDSPFAAEVTYFAIPKPTLLYIDTFVQTNSSLNTNLWGNVQQFPTVVITNPPSPIYGRTLIQMSYH